MADDDDTIYIDVAARLDEKSVDEVEGKLKGKLSHVGDSIKDSLSTAFDSIGDHLGGAGGPLDKLHDSISDAFSGREWDALGKQAGTALGRGVSESLKDLTQGNLGGVLDNFGHLGDVLGGALDKLTSRLDGLNQIGTAAGNVLSGSGSGKDLNDILSGAKGLGLHVPGAIDNAQHAFNLISFLNDHPGQIEDSLSRNVPGIGTAENIISTGPQKVGQTIHDWFTGARPKELAPGEYAKAHPVGDTGTLGGAGSLASVSTNKMDVSAGSVTLAGGISIPGMGLAASSGRSSIGTTSGGSVGSAGGGSGLSSLSSSGGGTLGSAGSGHYASGGVLPGGSPGYDNMIGVLPGGSMVGLEGGEGVINPRAMSQPGIAGFISQLNKGYDEGTMSPGGVGGDPNNLTLPTPPTQGNNAGSGGGQGTQQQQLGKGQGGGISGGGIIGAAEQAGVAAAGVAGFGGGAIAAQMAVQETNLAVQKTSQSIAALATAPFETFGLQGGMMGAPQVNPMGGWIGKLIAGELGSQTSLPNLAGSVQKPKEPQQKDPQQGQGETPTGPTGTRDDPHFVKSADGPPTPPQGAMTSAANLAPLSAGFG